MNTQQTMQPDEDGILKPRRKELPRSAAEAVDKIVQQITQLLDQKIDLCDQAFAEGYDAILQLYDQYQQALLHYLGQPAVCRTTCAYCCLHWVEDVYSFEIALLARRLRQNLPDQAARIRALAEDDRRVFEDLLRSGEVQHLLGRGRDEAAWRLLVQRFFEQRRPCPLLTNDRTCSVYSRRPLTCRAYISFRDPQDCKFNNLQSSLNACIVELPEEVAATLDELHFRFARYEGESSLRLLLANYLEDTGGEN
ncbi:MAG: hypothetical protein GF398_12065 [Chitinivibrionales bacterium]|nr:hypothetical protein [Chitinivibrionales bacterium]